MTKRFIVIGATGSGKSTLIRSLGGVSSKTGGVPVAGSNTRGVTSTAEFFQCQPRLPGIAEDVFLLDTVGFGDSRINITDSIAMIEEQAKHVEFHGIIVVQNIMEPRLTLSTQIIQSVAEASLKDGSGKAPWSKIIFCGTYADYAKPKHLSLFDATAKLFFDDAKNVKDCRVAKVGDDPEEVGYDRCKYTELMRHMAAVVGDAIVCQPVNNSIMSQKIARKFGGDPDQIAADLKRSRALYSKEWEESARHAAKFSLTLVEMATREAAEEAAKQGTKQGTKQVGKLAHITHPAFYIADAAQLGTLALCVNAGASEEVQEVAPRAVGFGGYVGIGAALGAGAGGVGAPLGAALGGVSWVTFEVLGTAVGSGVSWVMGWK